MRNIKPVEIDGKKIWPNEVFISYRGNYGWELALALATKLQSNGISVFYDKQELTKLKNKSKSWLKLIEYNIENCDVFISIVKDKSLFYNHDSDLNHDNMWYECQYAHKRALNEDNKELRILALVDGSNNIKLPQLDSFEQNKSNPNRDNVGCWGRDKLDAEKNVEFYHKYICENEQTQLNKNTAYSEIDEVVNATIEHLQAKYSQKKDTGNEFYSKNCENKAEASKEIERQSLQAKNLIEKELWTINNAIAKYDNLNVLDIGCGSGYKSYSIFGKLDKLNSLVGIDINSHFINYANEKYSTLSKDSKNQIKQSNNCTKTFVLSKKIWYMCADVTISEKLKLLLDSSIKTAQIDKFNVIYISFVLLHLAENKHTLLQTLRKYLSKDGVIIVVDIDDSFSISCAANDEDNALYNTYEEKYTNALSTGNRKLGRKIFALLKQTGFENVNPYFIIWSNAHKKGIDKEEFIKYDFELKKKEIENDLKNDNIRLKRFVDLQEAKQWIEENKDKLAQIINNRYFFETKSILIYVANLNK